MSRTALNLIIVHLIITAAGLMLHFKSHDPSQSLFFWWAAPVSLFNLIIVTGLYCHHRTVAWGVLFNGMSVGIGIIGMTYYSVKTLEPPYTPVNLILHSTLPYSFLLLAKLPLAEVIRREIVAERLPDST